MSSREEDFIIFLWDFVWGCDYYLDLLVIGGIGECDYVKVGFVDEFIDVI